MLAKLTLVLWLVVSCGEPPVTEYVVVPTTEASRNVPDSTFTPLPVTLTVTPTQPSLPTLSSTQIKEVVRDLYTNNGGCELPCLWGIVPQQTSVQDVYNNFSQIGTIRDVTRSVDALQTITFTTLPPSDLTGIYEDDKWSFHLRVKNNIMVGLLTGVTVIEEFSVPTTAAFLGYFGQPEEIWIRVIESMSSSEKPDYVIALYYPSKGIFISWRGEAESLVSQTEKGMTVMACPQYMPTKADTAKGSYPPFFYLFSPDEKMPFDEIIKTHISEDPGAPYQLLDKANTEKFYTMYLDPATQECFPLFYSFSP